MAGSAMWNGPFKYVFIPGSTSEDMVELSFTEKATLEDDAFNRHVKSWFAKVNSGAVDQDVLRQQIKAHAEKSKQPAPDLNDEMMAKLLEHASCDIFPIQVPTKEGGYMAVSLYCDDKGIAKGLDANVRATGLVHACGYTDQTIRGDCFIARMFDDDDAWYRCDFLLSDMSSDAAWVQLTKTIKGRGAGKSLSDLTGQLTSNPTVVAPGIGAPVGGDVAMEDASESDKYRWRQNDEEVEITAPLPAGTGKKDLKVDMQAAKLNVRVKGELLVGGRLGGTVEADECVWTLGAEPDGSPHIQLTLPKQRQLHWQRCLEA